MAFEDYEVSVESGQPVELYNLALGTTIWRMHNSQADEVISYSGDDYTHTIVGRGKIIADQETLEITLPADHQFSKEFVRIAPGQLATLTIFRYHRADTSDVRVVFKGVVRAIAYSNNGSTTKINLISITETFDKTIPDRTYQATCNNVLFDSDCKVSSASFKHTDIVTDIDANTIDVNGLSAKGDNWAKGGFVAYGALDFRLILGHTGDTLTLVLPFYEDVDGKSVNVYAGCDHCIGTCDTKFSNSINFGGCPWVPTKNIFTTGI